MTCKEAEQMVMPYINDELTDKELNVFLAHISECKSCYEELEIYYTLYAGLSQLDGENEGQDMHNLLQEAMRASQLRIRGHKILNIYYVLSQVLAMSALVGIIIMEIVRL
jgi:hypothetical protein